MWKETNRNMTKNVFEKCRYHYIKDGYKVYYITTHGKHKHYFNRIKEIKNGNTII